MAQSMKQMQVKGDYPDIYPINTEPTKIVVYITECTKKDMRHRKLTPGIEHAYTKSPFKGANGVKNEENGSPKPEGNGTSEGERKKESQSKGELQDVDYIHGVSKLKNPCSQLVCIGDQRECERSKKNGNQNYDHQNLHVATAIREVFGDSDDEVHAECTVQNQIDNEETVSRPGADKERNYEKKPGPKNVSYETKPKEKAAVPSLVVSTLHPPADPDNVCLISYLLEL
ncbi:Hypothetical predicted protein [Olea europaea subsp. europaea]|uniref:Uncharacterized protein n=1 Tax=Olea europaea subsp. europaea TaxID=158383 RepID=A0A8S0TPZ1_OLEEU|nr:Hypothetical predicted protein [Olea europaea subsp. europaea]